MKVGDYVRTRDGHIGRITFIYDLHIGLNDNKDYSNKPNIELDNWDECFAKNEIIKSSSNIKSVIEEDDFVNGERVNRVIPEDICGDELLDYQHIFVDDKEIYEEDIKSVLTKEQFESMEYKVGE